MLSEPQHSMQPQMNNAVSGKSPVSADPITDDHPAPFLARLAPDQKPSPPADAAERAERALVFHGASPKLIERLLKGSSGAGDAAQLLSSALKHLLKFAPLHQGSDSRIMLIGAPAAGKSSMIAKLAAAAPGDPPAVFTTDIARPGGMMRLSEYLSALDIEPRPLGWQTLPTAELAAIKGPILIDTAGIDAQDRYGLDALNRLATAMASEQILVVSALSDPVEARQLGDVARTLGVSRLFVTRLDMARRLGTVLAAAEAGLALCQGSLTANFAYGMTPLTPVLLADRLLALAETRSSGER